MLADYHVHTEFSDDSEYKMEQIVEDAIALGLDEICFTDHVDYGIKKDWDEPGGMIYRPGGPGEPDKMPLANPDYQTYYETFKRLKTIYADRISLKLYLKLGGRIITIGSDSHKKEHLGAYIQEARQCLKNLGYQEFCTYEKMMPIFSSLY